MIILLLPRVWYKYRTLLSSTATPNTNALQGGIVKHRYLGRDEHDMS